ncbi:hypothetical protein Tco_0121740 [Tanacetum coccineum]
MQDPKVSLGDGETPLKILQWHKRIGVEKRIELRRLEFTQVFPLMCFESLEWRSQILPLVESLTDDY